MVTTVLLREASRRKRPPPRGDFLERYSTEVRRMVLARLSRRPGLREPAEDLVQGIYLRVLEKEERFRGTTRAEFFAWVSKTIAGALSDRQRHLLAARRTVDREVLVDASSDSRMSRMCVTDISACRSAMAREDLENLLGAFDRLSPPERDVIWRARCLGHTARQIGARTARSEAAVRQMLRRSLLKLRDQMRGEAGRRRSRREG